MLDHRYIIGPPGTGKTATLKGYVEQAANAYGDDQVLVCSLTRAAASEIRGRNLSIPEDAVGTLHSFAYRAIGTPPVAESKLKEWNELHPRYALSKSKSSGMSMEDDEEDGPGGVGDKPGDEVAAIAGVLRHQMKPLEDWPQNVADFYATWSRWCDAKGYIDFTGMIEEALRRTRSAPGQPLAIFVDEAQDMSPLEIALLRKWALQCPLMIVVGDPAQALYTWRGADPFGFCSLGSHDTREVLGQSWRVPQAAHARAVRWAGSLLQGIRYLPTARRGSVENLPFRMNYGPGILDLVEEHLADPGSGRMMIQGLCSYMLDPALKALKAAAIPFHNPRRKRERRWNPLGAPSTAKAVSTRDRLLAYIADEQTEQTVKLWLPMLQAKGVFAHGAKARIEAGNLPGDIEDLFVSPGVAEQAFTGDLDWLLTKSAGEYYKRLEYPIAVVKAHGVEALTAEPRVMIGTIHSFKGSEAEHVVVAPDLSPAAHQDHLEDSLNVRRAFYVAMTRTSDRLEILTPIDQQSVDLW